MKSDNGDITASGVRKMSMMKAYWVTVGYLLIASVISSFLIGLLWFPGAFIIQSCTKGECDFHFGVNFLILKTMLIMGFGAAWIGPYISFPLIFIGAAARIFLQKHKANGLLPLILVASLIGGIYGQILKHVSDDPFSTRSLFFNALFAAGGFLTTIFAYPKLKTIDLKKE